MNSKKTFNLSSYFKKKNVKRFSIFFLIASLFLVFSKLSNDYKQIVNLRIKIINLEDEIILKENTSTIIRAYVEAKGFSLLPFIFNKGKTITVDAKTELSDEQNYYMFNVSKHHYLIEKQLGKSYSVISITPDTLRIDYSTRASKTVPLVLSTDINYASGYDIKNNFKLSLDSVKVIGGSEELAKISTLTTETLVLNEVKNNIEASVSIDISNYSVIEVFPKNVDVTAEVKRFTEGTIQVPVRIVNKPSDVKINFFPKDVKLVYYVDLENYKDVIASDFEVECDFAELKENQNYLVPKCVKKPTFIKRVTVAQNRIDFIKL